MSSDGGTAEPGQVAAAAPRAARLCTAAAIGLGCVLAAGAIYPYLLRYRGDGDADAEIVGLFSFLGLVYLAAHALIPVSSTRIPMRPVLSPSGTLSVWTLRGVRRCEMAGALRVTAVSMPGPVVLLTLRDARGSRLTFGTVYPFTPFPESVVTCLVQRKDESDVAIHPRAALYLGQQLPGAVRIRLFLKSALNVGLFLVALAAVTVVYVLPLPGLLW